MVYIIARFICSFVCHIFFGLKITGRKFIPRKGGCIIASNHLSFLDPPLVGSSVNRPTYFMGKSELFETKLSAFFFKRFHTFPVKRDVADHAAISKAVKFLKEGMVLVIFPEGGRNVDGSKEIQLGLGFLAQLANVPVVPALVVGSDIALPHGAKFIKIHEVEVRFGEPLYPQEFANTHLKRKELYRAITQKVMDKISELKNKNEDSNG